MIRHKATGPDSDTICLAGLSLPVLVKRIVVVDQKYSLSSISTLRDMVCHTGNDDSKKSRHPSIIDPLDNSVNGKVSP
jgi:hypothetical protein